MVPSTPTPAPPVARGVVWFFDYALLRPGLRGPPAQPGSRGEKLQQAEQTTTEARTPDCPHPLLPSTHPPIRHPPQSLFLIRDGGDAQPLLPSEDDVHLGALGVVDGSLVFCAAAGEHDPDDLDGAQTRISADIRGWITGMLVSFLVSLCVARALSLVSRWVPGMKPASSSGVFGESKEPQAPERGFAGTRLVGGGGGGGGGAAAAGGAAAGEGGGGGGGATAADGGGDGTAGAPLVV